MALGGRGGGGQPVSTTGPIGGATVVVVVGTASVVAVDRAADAGCEELCRAEVHDVDSSVAASTPTASRLPLTHTGPLWMRAVGGRVTRRARG